MLSGLSPNPQHPAEVLSNLGRRFFGRQPSATIYPRPTLIGWPFFLRVPLVLACFAVMFLRTPRRPAGALRRAEASLFSVFLRSPWRTPGGGAWNIKDLARPVDISNCPATATETMPTTKRPPEGGVQWQAAALRSGGRRLWPGPPTHRATVAPTPAPPAGRAWTAAAQPRRAPAASDASGGAPAKCPALRPPPNRPRNCSFMA